MTNLKFAVITALLLTLTAQGAEELFLAPPQHAGAPLTQHAVTNRAFQGIPSLAVTPKGRLWAVWYAGVTPGEDHNNYVVVSTSADQGQTWNEVLVVDPDSGGAVRAFDPELWMAPDGKLRLFWAQTIGYNCTTGGVWMMTANAPEAESADWQPPQRIANGVMMCKPIVLSSGEWALPVSTWKETDFSAKIVISSDNGKSWKIRGECNVPKECRSFDEHMLVERTDNSLWLLARVKYGIGESVSTDRGKTWPELKPSSITHCSSRFFISRLASGNLLLVKHGLIDVKTGRSHLTALISKDDGMSWVGGLLLDERAGVSYPDGQQSVDGTIYITYDYNRRSDRTIHFATFREEDAVAGKPVTETVRLRQIISQASGGRMKKMTSTTPQAIKNNEDGVALQAMPPGAWSCNASMILPFNKDVTIFSDRAYVVAEVPECLKKMSFVRVRMDGEKTLTCKQPGYVFVLTPTPERNRDSGTKMLLKHGFKKVSLPEVRLFNVSHPGNYCSLYQKSCAADEVITIGKWGVPLFLAK